MPLEPLGKFENKSKLLSNDEQQLVKVLARFFEHLTDHDQRLRELEMLVDVRVTGESKESTDGTS